MSTRSRPHSTSRARSQSPLSRPVTPLRPSSRSSFRASQSSQPGGASSSQYAASSSSYPNPLDALEPQFAELSDSMADLEANFMHLQLMHESLSRFGESFASFLYGLNMNAFVVDFPEQPLKESILRYAEKARARGGGGSTGDESTIMPDRTKGLSTTSDVDSTLLSDTTFASMKATPARRRTLGQQQQQPQCTKTPSRSIGNASANMAAKKTNTSGIPSRTRSSATRGGRGASRGSGLPTRGRGRGSAISGVR